MGCPNEKQAREAREEWPVIVGLAGLGISGGTLAALISRAGGIGFHSEAPAENWKVMSGHHWVSERGASGSFVFAQLLWGLPEEEGMTWFKGSTSIGAGLEEPDPFRLGHATENEDEIAPGGHFFTAGPTEAGAGQTPSTLMLPAGDGGFVAAEPSASPPPVETLPGPNDPQLKQTVAGPGDPAAPRADATEPGMLALLAAGALMGGRLCRARRKRL